MSLSFGRDLLAIPGPSVIPDRVLNAMHRASPNIYEGELLDLTDRILADLKTLAGTMHHAAIYIANGHGAWEAALANIFAPRRPRAGAQHRQIRPRLGGNGRTHGRHLHHPRFRPTGQF